MTSQKNQTPKHTRIREYQRPGKKRVQRIVQAFLAVPKERLKENPSYRCPAGPGLRPVPVEGAWYDYTDFLRRRYECGDLVDGTPPKATKTTKTTAGAEPAGDGEKA